MYRFLLFLTFVYLASRLSAQNTCAVSACCCGLPDHVGIPNGNFEDPPLAPPSDRITYFAGETYSTWTVLDGSIDVLGPFYSAFTNGNPNGPSQFIDLNGFTAGTIATTLTGLIPGITYTIEFWYAINPGATTASCTVQIAGGAWLNTSWSATNSGIVLWLQKCVGFTAQGSSAELRLIGSSDFATAGMLFDDITMWKCPVDHQPPAAVSLPPPLTVECSDPLPPANLAATDNCSAQVTVDFNEQTIPQSCFYNLLRTWTLTDECANTATVTQLILVRDTEAPAFTTPPQDYVMPCGSDYMAAFFDWIANHGYAAASDDCDPDLLWNATYQQAPSGLCGSIPVQFSVRDHCGNTKAATANFIIQDDEPPVMLTEAQNDTVWCATTSGPLLAWLNAHGGAQAMDPCGPVTWTNNYNGDSNATVITVTFTAMDKCQNAVSTTASLIQTEIDPGQTLNVDLGEDRSVSLGDTVLLQAVVNVPPDGLTSVNWWLGGDSLVCINCLTQVLTPSRSGTFLVLVTDNKGCSATDQVRIFVDRRKNLYAPNIFSPDGDGNNDVFLLFAKAEAVRKVRSFQVFDRWGEALCRFYDFLPNDPAFGWDGSCRHRPMNPSVYVWYAEVEFIDGETEMFSGNVTLVR